MFILICIKYGSLPNEIPSHYNFKGEIDSYSGKSILFSIPIISIILSLLINSLCFIPERYWNVSVSNPRIEITPQFRRSIIHICVTFFIVNSSIVSALFAYITTCMVYSISISITIIVIFIIVLFVTIILFIVVLYTKINSLSE